MTIIASKPALLLTLFCCVLCFGASNAMASSSQLSLVQDDAELYGEAAGQDPAATMAELRELGVDVIRTNVLFYRTFKGSLRARQKPSSTNLSNPKNYNWATTDRVVNLARDAGLKVLFTVSGPGPYWASEQPSKCNAKQLKGQPCVWKPNPKYFGQFVAAVAKRYKGKVSWYALYNEPNVHRWILPQTEKTKVGTIQTSGIYYRQLWTAGYKAIAKYDPSRRNKVLFGEVAAISAPLPTLNAALCLDPLTGKALAANLRSLYHCPKHPAKLNIAGFAIHPYNFGAGGSPLQKTNTKTSLPGAYLPRLHRLADRAARAHRIPGGRAFYITEFGYQSNPPDKLLGVSLNNQARYINESERMFFGDSRVKTVGQFELHDVAAQAEFNTGIRFAPQFRNGAEKPAYDAYRLPLVVTKRSSSSVEVWGMVRPKRLILNTSISPIVQADAGGGFATVATPITNGRGYFRITLPATAGTKFRLQWTDPRTGALRTSRTAAIGGALPFYTG